MTIYANYMPKNGTSKIFRCGKSPCLSHRFHGEYACLECIKDPTITARIEAKAETIAQDRRITELLQKEGHGILTCIDGMVTDGKYYYFCKYYGRCDYPELEDKCIWSCKSDNVSIYIFRQKSPIVEHNIYLFLNAITGGNPEIFHRK